MKRIFLILVFLAALVAAGYWYDPVQFENYSAIVLKAGQWAWDGIKSNPAPVGLAVGTFLLTVVYHKAKGKSLRESVEVAATRVAVVPISISDGNSDENSVVKRAKARAMRAQLIADQNGLQNRGRRLPEELTKAEKDACYTEQALVDAERKLVEKQKHHADAVAKLESLKNEKLRSEAELAEIDVEL
jgi:hypothetical protein